MKKKITSILVLLTFIAFGFSSCNDGDYEPIYYGIGTVVSPSISGELLIRFDDKEIGLAYPVKGIPKLPNGKEVKSGERVTVQFYLREKSTEATWYKTEIEIYGIDAVALADPMILERGSESDTLGRSGFYYYDNSGIYAADMYLTIGTTFLYNYMDPGSHWLTLAVYDQERWNNAADTVIFEFKHKASNEDKNLIPDKYAQVLYSFRMERLVENIVHVGKDSVVLQVDIPFVKNPEQSNSEMEVKSFFTTLKNPNKPSPRKNQVPKLQKNVKYNALVNY